MQEFSAARRDMVREQIEARGITDPRILQAMRNIPREMFLPADQQNSAYKDSPQPIGVGQTISQPYIVALMTAALKLEAHHRVLEIGTGSGYASAVIASIASEVFSVERHVELANSASQILARLGFKNVLVSVGDGTLGLPMYAPYDRIVVAAGGPHVPPSLLSQMVIGGRLVMPVGPENLQELIAVTRITETKFETEDLGAVRFVPLIGNEGWATEKNAPVGPAKHAPRGL